jgi:hypothetical protein
VNLAPVTRPNGKPYRPRKVIAHAWENNWSDDGKCGVLILGTHDDKDAQEFAERMCWYWYGLHAAEPVAGWYRDSFNDFGERAWIDDPVRGRAGVIFTAVERGDLS